MKTLLTIFLSIVALQLAAQKDKSLVASGNRSYKTNDYERAAKDYQKATDINSKNSTAQYNLGNALYKTKKNGLAQKAYHAAAETTTDKSLKPRSYYNEGVASVRQSQLQQGIKAFKESLKIDPTDNEARENLQKALNELKKQQQQQQNNQQQNKKNKDQDKNKQEEKPEKNNSSLNKKQAEQMLNSLRQEEKKLQQDLQNKNQAYSSNSKDW